MKMRCEIIKSERLELWIQKHILLHPYYMSSTRVICQYIILLRLHNANPIVQVRILRFKGVR